MSNYFLDSSALIKRYVVEVGTPWIRSVTAPNAGNVIIIAHITPVEVVSGAMRRKRDGSITARTSRAVRLLVDRHANRDHEVIDLTAPIVARAEDLLERHTLRAYDSIQLASALMSNARLLAADLPAMTFVSADTRLLSVAAHEGLTTDDPTIHSRVFC